MSGPDAARRRRWFALAALALLAAAALALALRPAERPQPRPAAAPQPAARSEAAPPVRAARRLDAPRARADRPHPASGALRSRALAAAAPFARALTRYELGELRPAVRRALHATATPQLAARLLGRPPRLPTRGRPPRARVGRIRVVDVGPKRGWALVTLRRAGRADRLVLELARVGERFAVAGVR